MGTGLGLIAGANKFQFKEKYDALKANEQKSLLAIPNKKLSDTQAKQKDLTDLTTLLGSFKGDISSLVEGEAFSKSKVDATGESASMTTTKGVKVSDFDINVKQLATKDAYQTNSFSSETYGIFNDVGIIKSDGQKEMLKEAEFKITVNKQTFTIKVNSGDSLQTLNDKILSATNENNKKLSDFVSTKVLDTGHDNYRLMITSKEAGIDNEIVFGSAFKLDDPNTAEFSKAVLKKLGLLDAANASAAKTELKKANEQLDASKVILGGSGYLENIQKQVSELAQEKELKYKAYTSDSSNPDNIVETEITFKINKDTDLSKLSADQRKAVFAEFKDKNDMTQQTKNWVEYIKNTGEELNISYKDSATNQTKAVSINKATDFSKLSEDEKKGIQEFFETSRENYFINELDVKAAQTKYDGIDAKSNHVQTAQDAKFIYEGIEISRSTNTIDDLIIGAKISLKKEGITNFKVSDDLDSLTEHLTTFTTNYNSIVNSLATSTGFDKEKKTAGSLQGISEVSKLKTMLSSMITKTDSNGISLSGMGFELNEKGILTFKKSKFEEAYKKNSEGIKNFLQGSVKYQELSTTSKTISQKVALAEGDLKINGKEITFKKEFLDKLNEKDSKVTQEEYINKLIEAINDAKIDGVTAKLGKENNIIITSDGKNALEIGGSSEKLLQLGLEEKTMRTIKTEQTGVFRTFKDTLDSMVGTDGTLTKYNKNLEDDVKKLNEEIKKTNEEIEKRYEILATRLSMYDVILNKLDNQSQTITALTNAAFANK
ncbi:MULTISPECIES: flagellar filament capping protein FliD [unclassified Campylobacter]|uniref:flagellar filament capping protein FliD n=1 Tax=unclassified Campylobacter TaxID=2593542 RepID=UPI001E0834DE|nr:flagellar filament capping protein FliD [Campylobacter sp. RM9331]MBZ8005012.1 flagellar filament capping protein FliD [Campylobacter sp. RM9332]